MLIALLVGCPAKVDFTTPIPLDDTFGHAEPTPEERERFVAAATYSREHHGLSFLVIRGTDVIFEDWPAPPTTPHHLYSGTKTFGCLLAAIGAAEGAFDLDTRVLDAVPAFDDEHPERKDEVTVGQLLHFTSGLDEAWWSLTRDGLLLNPKVEDKVAVALAQPVKEAPGSVFEYGSVHLFVMDGVVEERLGDPLTVLQSHLFDRMNFRTAGWIRDPAGHPALPYGAWTTATEWAKIGVLLRDDGEWQGERLLPEGLLRRCAEGSDANPAYGLTMWLNRSVPSTTELSGFDTMEDWEHGERILRAEGPDDLFAAAGALNQRLYVLPSQDLVVVRQGDKDRHFRDGELLDLLLGE
ncbi:MAG: beta-lactamase family protein [Myxococcales bacterium]|nr:beta-lactamase family protein [Myxococcales bacterium]